MFTSTVRRSRRSADLVMLFCMTVLLLGAACGGDSKSKDAKAARNPTDPRRVPTATVPAQLPAPITAIESGQQARTSLPETYVVKAGDTIGVIAGELGITAEALTAANPSIDPRGLRIGQELRIPRPTPSPTPARPGASPSASPGRTPAPSGSPARTPAPSGASPAASPTPTATRTPAPATTPSGSAQSYSVEAGDTACGIARRFGVALTALAQANGQSVDAIANLRVGQSLQIPRSTGESPGC